MSGACIHSVWNILQRSRMYQFQDETTDLPIATLSEILQPDDGGLYQDNSVAPYHDVQYRRYRGFRKRSTARSTSHDVPSPFWLMHKAWSFLEPANRKAMCITHPAMMSYASLRLDAFLPAPEIRHELQRKRNHPDCEPQLDTRRARFMGAALLSFDFDYGDLVRWLGDEYTNQH